MKFVTSTDLKQWADTKECQQLLPEPIKKLIDASALSVDKISFPSGDATSLPGWDGIVSCDEKIDLSYAIYDWFFTRMGKLGRIGTAKHVSSNKADATIRIRLATFSRSVPTLCSSTLFHVR